MRSIPVKMIGIRASRRAIVDDEDYEALIEHKWHEHSAGYAVTKVGRNPSYKDVYMHREVMRLHDLLGTEKDVIDHINHNKLDNRKNNLRSVSHADNVRNRYGAQKNNKTSGILGVSWSKARKKWKTSHTVLGKEMLGLYFVSREDAERIVQNYRNTK